MMIDLQIEDHLIDDEPTDVQRVIWKGVDIGYVYRESMHVTIYQRMDDSERRQVLAAINKELPGERYLSVPLAVEQVDEEQEEDDDDD